MTPHFPETLVSEFPGEVIIPVQLQYKKQPDRIKFQVHVARLAAVYAGAVCPVLWKEWPFCQTLFVGGMFLEKSSEIAGHSSFCPQNKQPDEYEIP